MTMACAMNGKAIAANATAALPDVDGMVIDETGAPMPFANVVLLSAADSSFVEGLTSDEAGRFSIKAATAPYILRISSVGYTTKFINIGASAQNSCTVQMETNAEVLGDVEVKAQLPKTKLTPRGMQTAVQGSVLENLGSAEDALARVPGLIKTNDGLSVLGKGAPIYYINGRRVHDLQELKQLRSTDILSVEVINNPGAQYDATVNAVVRIKTVKRQGDGFGFNTGVTDEQSLRTASNNDPSAYFNGNWRRGNVDLFAGTSWYQWHNVQSSDLFMESYGNNACKQDGHLEFKQNDRGWNFNGGANWQINDQHSVGFRVDRSLQTLGQVRQSLEEDYFLNGVLQEHILAVGHHDIDEKPNSLKVNTYYNGQAGKLGIDVNADYYVQHGNQLAFTDETSSATGASAVNTDSHSKSELWASKVVFTYPIWVGQLQVGNENTISRRNEDYTIASTGAGTTGNIPATTAEVKEDNYAAFIEYGLYLPKVGQLSAGLRYEHVRYTYDEDFEYLGTVINGHNNVERTQDNFFPSFAWANAFMAESGSPLQVAVSYSMKTIRPDFNMLNSALRYHNRYVWQSGDAMLTNQVNHELGMNARWKIFTLMGNYVVMNDALSNWSSLHPTEPGVVMVKNCNLSDPVHKASYYVNLSPTFGCWTLNYTAGIQQQWLSIDANDPREATGRRTLNFDDTQFVAQCFNTWRFGAKKDGSNAWQADLGATLQTKGHTMNAMQTNNYLTVSASLQKSFLKNDALTVKFEVTDLTKTADYNVRTDSGTHLITQTNQLDQHRIKLGVYYTFNAARSKYKGTGAGKEAQERMSK